MIHRLSDDYRVVEEQGAFYPQVRYVYPPLKQIDWGSIYEEDHLKVRRGTLSQTIAFLRECGCNLEKKETNAFVEQTARLIAESGLSATYTIEMDRIEVYREHTYVVRVAGIPELDQWFVPIINLILVVQRVIRRLKYRQWLYSTKRETSDVWPLLPHRNISACTSQGGVCPHQYMSASYHGSGSVL